MYISQALDLSAWAAEVPSHRCMYIRRCIQELTSESLTCLLLSRPSTATPSSPTSKES